MPGRTYSAAACHLNMLLTHDPPARSFAALNTELWHESLDAMDAAIVLYDRQDRIVVCNRNFRELYAGLEEFTRPGTTFELLLRRSVECGLLAQADDDAETFIAQRLAEHAQPGAPILRQFCDGHWRRITEQRLAGGGLLAFSIDVTELVESRQALQEARDEARRIAHRLEDAVEALPAGIEVYDADDRLVLSNSVLRSMYPRIAELMPAGLTFEELVRRNRDAGGLPGVAPGDEEWLAARLARRRRPSAPLEQRIEGDRWIRTYERRTRDGGLVGVRVDITELVNQRCAAELASTRLNDAIEALPEGFALYDDADRLVACNQRYRDMYTISAAAMTPGTSFESILRYGLARGQYPMAEGRQEDWIEERLHRHRHPEQPVLQELPGNRWLRIDERRSRQGGIVGVRTDVTELVCRGQQLEKLNASLVASRAQLRAIIGTALSAIVTVDEQGKVLSANPATHNIFGWQENDLVGLPLDVMLPSFGMRHVVASHRAVATHDPHAATADGGVRIDTVGRHRDGTPLAVQLALSRLNMAGPPRYVALITDLSEREAAAQALRVANAQLARLSETDPLTNIANRRRFDHELRDEWQRSARDGSWLALLIVDVDHFKRYNDSAGHPAGDACLQRIAELLQDSVQRSSDLVARYGGEEFALLLPQTNLEQAMLIARGCIDKLERAAIAHPDSPLGPHVTLSIGVASARAQPGTSPNLLVGSADAAVYAAKRIGRRCAFAATTS